MAEPAEKRTSIFAAEEIDAARDLRNTLLFVGILVVGLAAMILAASPNVIALQIPPLQLSLVALTAVLIAFGGIIALQSGLPVRTLSWTVLVAYTLIVSITVHYTGGPLTPVPALYLLVTVGASFLLGRRGATLIALLGVACYALILALEYTGVLPMIQIWRLSFSPRERGSLLIINWLALTIPTLVTAQLAGTLAERLKQTNLHLRESERLRDTLTHMVVHDLRNPLTGLLGWLDLLQSVTGPQMTESQRQLLDNARHSGHILLEMVGELLDISKMEAGKLALNLKPVDLCGLLEEGVATVRALAELEGLTVTVEACAPQGQNIPCDSQLIGRVIVNLLSNAIKHTPPGGQIALKVQPHADDTIRVSVTDTGEGIPPQYQQLIFEKFGQVQLPGQERRGTGLGLTFCKLAVEAHGGRIWVESQVGQGSTFSFTLPLAREAAAVRRET